MDNIRFIGEIATRSHGGLSLQNADALFCALIENAFEMILILDANCTIRYANPSAQRVLGYVPDELLGNMLLGFIHPDDMSHVSRFLDEVKSDRSKQNEPNMLEIRVGNKNGSWRILECFFKAIDTPSLNGTVIHSRDITVRKKEDAIRTGQSHVIEMIATGASLQEVLGTLVRVMESQMDGTRFAVLMLDEDGVHMQHGAGLRLPENGVRSISGYAAQSGQPVIMSDIESDPHLAEHRELAERHGFRACYSAPIFSVHGRVLGTFDIYFSEPRPPSASEQACSETARRIAGIAIERMRSREKIYHMAYHDPLTGLPNRVLLLDRLKQAVIHAHRIKDGIAVLFIDLDQFKHVNDTLGHQVGDRLLQMVAQRLQQCMRKDDSLARLGGDEFVLTLMAPADSHSAAQVAQKILDILEVPLQLEGHELHISCSIGISLYPSDGEDAQTLISNADNAMYHAKARGRGNYQYFTPELNAAVQYRHSVAKQLRLALAKNEFSLDYQCQVDMDTGNIFAMEALLRWRQAERGQIAPVEFLSIAEETGLILPIGEWVLREGCTQLKRWIDAGHKDLRISFNLSVYQLLQRNLVDMVTHILDETGLPASAMALEINEKFLMPPIEEHLAILARLNALGVQISLDDFGTGYSSLSYLQRFPLNTLKIDQAFVRGIGHNPNDMAVANAIIAMARTFDMTVIAEGVETIEQAIFLREHGCQSAQGYYYGRPVTAEVMTGLLRKNTRGLDGNSSDGERGDNLGAAVGFALNDKLPPHGIDPFPHAQQAE